MYGNVHNKSRALVKILNPRTAQTVGIISADVDSAQDASDGLPPQRPRKRHRHARLPERIKHRGPVEFERIVERQ